jgi:uncharacterized protein DUF5670
MSLIAVFLLGLWIAGLITSYTMGGFIHVLLVLSLVALFSKFITANRSSRLAELRSMQPEDAQSPAE